MAQEPHTHDDGRGSYYLDQLFLIATCGAVAAVSVALFVEERLGKVLDPKIRPWIFVGGLTLMALVLARAVAVWRSVDEPAAVPPHDHEHEHGPDCGHAHEASTAVQTLPLTRAPVHSHGHGHSHSHGDDHEHGWAPWRYVVMLLPVALYFLVLSNPEFDREPIDNPQSALEKVMNFITNFRSILFEALPFIVLGSLVAGLLEELVPQQAIARILPRRRSVAILLGGLLGLAFPMCECGIIPVMRRLLRKGLPLSCCVAYMLAGPIINFVVILSTWVAFQGMENTPEEGGRPSYQMGSVWMVGFRVGMGYLVAVVTALIVDRVYDRHGDRLLKPVARPSAAPGPEGEDTQRRPLGQRVNNITATALHDFVDITVFLILGALLAAGVRTALSGQQIADLSRQHAVLTIGLMMGLAITLCLCSEADAFVAASFSTMRPAAKLAFLVLGPMLDFKLLFMYTRVFRPRLIWTIVVAVVAQVFLYSTVVHLVWERYAPSWIDPKIPKPVIKPSPVPQATTEVVGLLASPLPGPAPVVTALAALHRTCFPEEVSSEIGFRELEMAAWTPEARNYYTGKRVMLSGRYRGLNERVFTLTRFRMSCCAADAVPLRATFRIPAPDPKAEDAEAKKTLPVSKLQDKWVEVTGRVTFEPSGPGGGFIPTIVIEPNARRPLHELVQAIAMPSDPYIR